LSFISFWGALSNSPKYTSNLEAWFINRDADRVGNALWDAFANVSTPGPHLGWVLVDPDVAGTNAQIVDAIIQQQTWIAVVSASWCFLISHSRACASNGN
jgi:hypothetical protein